MCGEHSNRKRSSQQSTNASLTQGTQVYGRTCEVRALLNEYICFDVSFFCIRGLWRQQRRLSRKHEWYSSSIFSREATHVTLGMSPGMHISSAAVSSYFFFFFFNWMRVVADELSLQLNIFKGRIWYRKCGIVFTVSNILNFVWKKIALVSGLNMNNFRRYEFSITGYWNCYWNCKIYHLIFYLIRIVENVHHTFTIFNILSSIFLHA